MRKYYSDLKIAALIMTGYFLLAYLGLSHSALANFVSVVWLPSGVAMASLIVFGLRFWPAVFLAAFLINYYYGATLIMAFLMGFGNSMESLMGAYLCFRFSNFEKSLDNVRDVLSFFTWGALIATTISATIGVFSLWIGGVVDTGGMSYAWLTWWIGDAAGVLTVGPAIIVLFGSKISKGHWTSKLILETILLVGGLGLVCWLVFNIEPSTTPRLVRSYFIFPLLIWAALRYGQIGAACATFLISFSTIWSTAQGKGPFVMGSSHQNLIHLLVFVLAVAITGLIVGAVVSDREKERRNLKQTAEDLSQREKELKLAKELAESANAAKTAFLANMSHEIRTPLGVVLGFSEVLTSSDLTEEEKINCVEAIKRNGNLLSNIINDILDLSKVEAGKMDVEKIDIPFDEVVKDISTLLNLEATEKGIKLTLTSEDIIPRFIRTDPLRLRQVILNIVGNAIKFTDRGSVDIRIKLLKDKNQLKLAFVVKDTGRGISEEQKTRLFSPFSQADSSTTRRYGGTGLGLILSRKLAQALGGDVVLTESQLGEGSTFTITVDAGSPEKIIFQNFESGVRTTRPEKPYIGSLSLKILLVEDSLDNQVLISRHLKNAGAIVETASSGKDALKKAEEKSFDLILMDLQMPVMDGYEVAKRLRENGYSKPIIALTAHAMREDRIRCLANGFNDHLSKPIDRDSLLRAISYYAS